MQDMVIGPLAIVGACLLVAIVAVVLVVFRPTARRRRRHKRRSERPRIDLFAPPRTEAPTEPDA